MPLFSSATGSILYDTNNNIISTVDSSTITPGTQSGFPIIGQSSNVGKIIQSNCVGHLAQSNPTMLFMGPLEGSNLNSYQWYTKVLTQTIAQSNGVITLNNNSSLASTGYSILMTNRYYPLINNSPLLGSFRAKVTYNTNGVAAFGFIVNPESLDLQPIVLSGAFFRITGSGVVNLVLSTSAVETVTVSNTILSTSYYNFIVIMNIRGAQFIVEDSSGVPIIDQFVSYALTASGSGATHVQSFAHNYYPTTNGVTATKLDISSHQVYLLEVQTNKKLSEQYSGGGRVSAFDATTNAVTMQAASAAPTQTTLITTAAAYNTLGGEFWLNALGSSETPYGVFSYQVPSNYNLIITDIWMSPPVVTTVLGATIHINQWFLLINNATATPSATGGFRYSIATFSAAASATVGTMFNGSSANLSFETPLVVMPGMYLNVVIKPLSGVATGAYRGSINFNGYFE